MDKHIYTPEGVVAHAYPYAGQWHDFDNWC